MKFSKDTLEIFKNFQEINRSVFLGAGDTIRTLRTSLVIMAEAKIEETLPFDLAIYDFPRLNTLLNMFPDSEIEIGDKHLVMNTQAMGSVKYHYTDKVLLEPALAVRIGQRVVFPNEIVLNLPPEDLKLELSSADFQTAIRVAAALDLPSISFVTEGDKLNLKVVNPKSDLSNTYSKPLCDCRKKFNLVLKTENLKILPRDYIISICGSFLKFTSKDGKLTYWLNSQSQ